MLIPYTTPVLFTEAVTADAVLQTPPVVALVSVVLSPRQTVADPKVTATVGVVITSNVVVAAAEPQKLLTV